LESAHKDLPARLHLLVWARGATLASFMQYLRSNLSNKGAGWWTVAEVSGSGVTRRSPCWTTRRWWSGCATCSPME